MPSCRRMDGQPFRLRARSVMIAIPLSATAPRMARGHRGEPSSSWTLVSPGAVSIGGDGLSLGAKRSSAGRKRVVREHALSRKIAPLRL